MTAIVRLDQSCIALPHDVLAALRLRDGDELIVAVEGGAIRLGPRRTVKSRDEFTAAARSRLERLMSHCGGGRGAYADAAEADAFIREGRGESLPPLP